MTTRFRLTYRGSRGGMFYCVDRTTGKRTRLQTTGRDAVQQVIDAKIHLGGHDPQSFGIFDLPARLRQLN